MHACISVFVNVSRHVHRDLRLSDSGKLGREKRHRRWPSSLRFPERPRRPLHESNIEPSEWTFLVGFLVITLIMI